LHRKLQESALKCRGHTHTDREELENHQIYISFIYDQAVAYENRISTIVREAFVFCASDMKEICCDIITPR